MTVGAQAGLNFYKANRKSKSSARKPRGSEGTGCASRESVVFAGVASCKVSIQGPENSFTTAVDKEYWELQKSGDDQCSQREIIGGFFFGMGLMRSLASFVEREVDQLRQDGSIVRRGGGGTSE